MQWQTEDAMLHGLAILESLRAREQYAREAVSDAEQRVLERVRSERG